jgi:peptidoglycan hydrolase-like protein with peptidoglycan-binding domain
MEGFDVWAVQIALNAHGAALTEDGDFGPLTESAVKAAQVGLRITVDGIAGPQTQAALCAAECARAESARGTPVGLLKGMCFGESGGIIPTTSPLYPNGTRDYGPFQDNKANPTQAQLREAFDPRAGAATLASFLNAKHATYALVAVNEEAWRLAVLSFNWPAAAYQIANGNGDTWVYTESGTGAKRHLADPAPWVESYGITGVSTGWDWVRFYVATKVVYVKSWGTT